MDMIRIVGGEQLKHRVWARSVGEIGVHQGKSFVWLEAGSFAHEKTFALDIFDMQHLNVDASGGTGLSIASFWRNIKPIFGKRTHDHVTIVRAMSSTIDACNFSSLTLSPIRLFSIDGSHTGENTYGDMKLAASVLARGGCMFVDDYLNPGWLGVHEGVHRFLNEERNRWAPLSIAAGKFWICDVDFVHIYLTALSKHLPAAIRHRSRELNREMTILTKSKMYGISMVFVKGS